MAQTASLPQANPIVNSRHASSSPITNTLVGLIVAQHGSQHRQYRLRTAGGVTLTFRYAPLPDWPDRLDIGQQVTLTIPSHAVTLSPRRPISAAEINVWPARVVLSSDRKQDSTLIVKIQGRSWTLTSTWYELGLVRPLHVWASLTVHVSPDACVVTRRYPGDIRLRPRLLTVISSPAATPSTTQSGRRPTMPGSQGQGTSLLCSLPTLCQEMMPLPHGASHAGFTIRVRERSRS